MYVRGANGLSQPDTEGPVGIAEVCVRFGLGFESRTEKAIVAPVDDPHNVLNGIRPDDSVFSELFDQLALVLSRALPGTPHVALVLERGNSDNR